MSRPESPEPGSCLGQRAALIKTEPECDALAFDYDVIVKVEQIKSEAEQLLYADHEVKEEMVIGPTELQRPKQTPGVCARGGECSAELRARATPHDNGLPHNSTQPQLEPSQCQSSSDASLQPCHSTPHLRFSEPDEEVSQCRFDHEVIVERIKSEEKQLLYADHEMEEDMVINSREVQRPAPGVCARGGECSAELKARATPHDNGPPHNPTQPQLEPSQCQSSSDASLQPCHSTPHQRKHSTHKAFICHDCHKIFQKKSKLASHVRVHGVVQPFVCDVWDKKFTQSGHLIRHKRIHSGERPFACDVCEKKFTQSGDLKKHKRFHSGERPFACDFCDKKFTQSGDLNRHKNVHTGERPFECDVCDKKFTRAGNLIQHKKIHSGVRSFACDFCEKKFTVSGNLIRHKKIHSGVRPFACDVCEKKFTRSGDLQTHKIVHSGERPFACDVCDKKFTKSGDLNRHKKVHTGERPFECDVCDKKFTRSVHLITHKQIHSGVRPFACDVCEKKFTQSGHLNRHKKVHSGERPTRN